MRRMWWMLMTAAAIVVAPIAAAAQAPLQPQAWFVPGDTPGTTELVAFFPEPFTMGSGVAVEAAYGRAGLSAVLDLDGVDMSAWMPGRLPTEAMQAYWGATDGPDSWELVVYPSELGGVGGIGIVMRASYFQEMGPVETFSAGTGWMAPDSMFEFTEIGSLPDRAALDEQRRAYGLGAPFRWSLTGPEGDGQLVAEATPETTTTTTTVVTTTAATSTTIATEPTAGAAEVPVAAPGEAPTDGDTGVPVGFVVLFVLAGGFAAAWVVWFLRFRQPPAPDIPDVADVEHAGASTLPGEESAGQVIAGEVGPVWDVARYRTRVIRDRLAAQDAPTESELRRYEELLDDVIDGMEAQPVTNLTDEERNVLERAQREAKDLRERVRRWISGEEGPSDGQFETTVL